MSLRSQQRFGILVAIVRELARMDKELAQLVSDWTLSAGILYLIYMGIADSTIGLATVMVITSIDIARLWEIYIEMKTSGELKERMNE